MPPLQQIKAGQGLPVPDTRGTKREPCTSLDKRRTTTNCMRQGGSEVIDFKGETGREVSVCAPQSPSEWAGGCIFTKYIPLGKTFTGRGLFPS